MIIMRPTILLILGTIRFTTRYPRSRTHNSVPTSI